MTSVGIWAGRVVMALEVAWYVYFISVGLTAPALLAFFVLTIASVICLYLQRPQRVSGPQRLATAVRFYNGVAFFAITFPAAVIVGLLLTYLDYFEFAVAVFLAAGIACSAFLYLRWCARRDADREFRIDVLCYYLEKSGSNLADFRRDYLQARGLSEIESSRWLHRLLT